MSLFPSKPPHSVPLQRLICIAQHHTGSTARTRTHHFSCTLFYHLPHFSIYLIFWYSFFSIYLICQSTPNLFSFSSTLFSHLTYISSISFSNLTFSLIYMPHLLIYSKSSYKYLKTQSTSFYHLPNISFYPPVTLFALHYVPSHGRSYLVTPQKTHEMGSTVYVSDGRWHHWPISHH